MPLEVLIKTKRHAQGVLSRFAPTDDSIAYVRKFHPQMIRTKMMNKADLWITTLSGKRFHPYAPRVPEYDIEDIANALSMQCRFAGHVTSFYSVAQHSVHAAVMAPLSLKMHALLHDGQESYVTDIPSPVKAGLGDAWADLENNVEAVLHDAFSLRRLTIAERHTVKMIDLRLCCMEGRTITRFPDRVSDWDMPPGADEGKSMRDHFGPAWRAWSPTEARVNFLQFFHALQLQNLGLAA